MAFFDSSRLPVTSIQTPAQPDRLRASQRQADVFRTTSRGSQAQRVIRFLIPNLSYPFVLAGIAFEPFTSLRVRSSIGLGDLFFLIAAPFLVVDLLSRRARLWMPWWILAAGACLFLSFLIQTFSVLGGYLHGDLIAIIGLAFACFFIPTVIASQRLASSTQLNLLISMWLVANLVGALIVVLQHQGVDMFMLQDYLRQVGGRPTGLTGHPNNLGLFEALTASLCLALAFGARALPGYVFWVVSTGLIFRAIDLAGSRTALVAAILSCGFVILMFSLFRLRTGYTSRYLKILALIVAGILAALFYQSGSLGALNRLSGNTESTRMADLDRAERVRASLEVFWDHLLAGSGHFNSIQVDNVFVASLERSGMLGLVFLLLLQGGFAWYVVRLLRMGLHGRRDFAMSVGVASLYAAWLLDGIKESIVLWPCPLTALGIIALYCVYDLQQPAGTERLG
jgi:hypothetical protein